MKAPSNYLTHHLHPSILREYDIRGIVGETLTPEDALFIGKAFGTMVLQQSTDRRICVGFDGRLSSPEMEEALVKGLLSTGAEVIRIGLGPTPMLYFAARTLQAAGAVMVTGSHNPANHNGFKFMVGKGSLHGAGIQALGELIEAGKFLNGSGSIHFESFQEQYVATLRHAFDASKSKKNLTVAWDAGNGATGKVIESLCKRLPGKHILINTEIDGTFPEHHPDPTVAANLEQLIQTVVAHRCDVGIAFDGDGDRIGVVDPQGRIIWGDQMMVFFARDLLKRHPGATIIADVKASQVFFDEVAKAGGTPLMWKTGHSLIKSKMMETGALLAGEMSAHLFFADEYFGYDDGVYAAIRLLRILATGENSLADMLNSLPIAYNTPEIRIDCQENRKFLVIEEVRERLKVAGIHTNAIDGVRVTTNEGWWLLRASNTQPALVARCEASSAESLERLKHLLKTQLAASGITLSDNDF